MVKTDGEAKSLKSTIKRRRKPLRDVSNGAVKSSSNSFHFKSLNQQQQQQQQTPLPIQNQQQQPNSDGDPLDRLLFVHSLFSSLLPQIDELVVKAVKVNTTDNQRIQEIKSFTTVLSDIHSTLKLWVPRLEKTLDLSCTELETQLQTQLSETGVGASLVDDQGDEFAVDTPKPIKHGSLVSPSPLVSWRATGCLEERGKQLFLLTPLLRPKSTTSKGHPLSKLATCEGINLNPTTIFTSLGTNGESNNGMSKVVAERLEEASDVSFVSAQKVVVGDSTPALNNTPCMRNLPLRSNVLYEPDHEVLNRKIAKSHKSTPFPIGDKKLCDSTDSESSSGEVSMKLGLKYPELIGIQLSCMSKNESKALEASPAWIMSPPKCCTLLEPLNEKNPRGAASLQELPELAATFNQQLCLVPAENKVANDEQDKEKKKISLHGNLRSNFAMVEGTPLWKGCESTIQRGKRPAGENTLKRELWTRFEAASTDGYGVFKDISQKGFLEMLEEASSDESIAPPDASR